MNIKLIGVFVVLMSFFQAAIVAQPVFIHKTKQYKRHLPTRSVMPGAIIDLDGDLVDDIAVLDQGVLLKVFRSSGKNFALTLMDSIPVSQNTEWTVTAGDINNDGTPELISSGEYNAVSMMSFQDGRLSRKMIPGNVYAQASNTVDINNDGWLDYFLCNDDGPNKIYLNDKKGNLVLTQVIDFKQNDPTDGSGNYGSEWVDVNGDMFPDLCISKCRAGVNDENDPRRINRLYINQGNGTFKEEGKTFGLDSGKQSWVTTFGDIDNDGDLDAIVINHYAPHILMENIEGRYFKEIVLSEKLESFGFQAAMRDFDNDGWLDILITGVEGTMLLHNKGNKSFEIIKQIIGPNLARSLTVGDINDDGFVDIYAHMCEPINIVGLKSDEIWLNQGNENHFIKFNLSGSSSNTSGIGSRIEVYGSWGKQIRYVKGGESYGIFNSLQQHIGLGKEMKVDSVIVRWPSGMVDKYSDGLEADQTYLLQEGRCISKQLALYEDLVVYKDSLVTLSAPEGYQQYRWNNASVNQQISIAQGVYHVSMTDQTGCITVSKPISVVSGCFTQATSLINEDRSVKACAGFSVELSAVLAAKYEWSTGSTDNITQVNSTQNVVLKATDFCGNIRYDTVDLEFVDITFDTKGDTVKKGETATLISDDKNTVWFAGQNLNTPIHIGDTLVTGTLDTTTTFYAKTKRVIDSKTAFVGEKTFPLTNAYGANSTAGGLVFNVERSCILRAVKVNTDSSGVRKIIITDQSGDTIFAKEIYLTAGIQRLILDANLVPGKLYTIATDINTNLQNFGYRSPRFVRTFNGTSYPYEIDQVLTILSSTFGAIYYYYFYDWEVQYDIQECESEYRQVVAQVEGSSAVIENDFSVKHLTVIPNPASDFVTLAGYENAENIHIYDLLGRHMNTLNHSSGHIDVRHLASGWYVISVQTGQTLLSGKFYKH